MKSLSLIVAAFAVSACATGNAQLGKGISRGEDAYALFPSGPEAAPIAEDYRIGSLDTVDVSVFQEPELSQKAIQVDASGRISLPLIGSVPARGKTASQLSRELEILYGERYLRDPQVTVAVASSVSQKVAVQGEVTEPGVFPVNGTTTLLEVISLAKGETRLAKLNQVVVFRNVGGKRMGAVFDVASIRRGEASDPVIQGNDLVVVGYSSARRFWSNILSTAPLFNVFRPIL